MDRGPEKNSTNIFPVRTEQANSITSIYSIHSIYGELVEGKLPVGRPKLRYKDVCKRDMKFSGLDTGIWAEHSWLGNNTSGVAAEEQRERPLASFQQLYMRHSSPARIVVVSANLTLDYLATTNVAASVKTSDVR